MFKSPLMRELDERGFIKQTTNAMAIDDLALAGTLKPYVGFDLTAPSLHVGSLIPLMVLRTFIEHGFRPIVVFGSATTRIGDPTGKNAARPILPDHEIATNLWSILRIVDIIVGVGKFEVVDNNEWLGKISFMDVMRDSFSRIPMGKLLTLDAIKNRLDAHDPMSLMEVCYSAMQAMDFRHLNETKGVNLQIGGSDQWSNIIAGTDLIRRRDGREAHGMTLPLLTKSNGEKFGKSTGGAVWLSTNMTSPFDFFQFWRNVEDAKVLEFLNMFTRAPVADNALMVGEDINQAKKVLAFLVTRLVRGDSAAREAEATAEAIFANGTEIALQTVSVVFNEIAGKSLATLMVRHKLAVSMKDAERLSRQGAVTLNRTLCTTARETIIQCEDIVDGRVIVRVGKKLSIGFVITD